MLSCCCFCSGKFQSPRTEHLSSPPLLSSLPSESSCLLPCILSLLLLHTASSSNLSSHHSKLVSIRLRAAPFNITIIQVYAPTSGHDDSKVDHFYQQLKEIIDQTPKKDILVVQGDWNAKVGKDALADWGDVCGPYCNVETNERGLRLLEFATFNNLVLTNTLGPHKPSRRLTWHSPDGKRHNQIDYILVKKRFRSGFNIYRTRSFPGADIGSGHYLVMMTFSVRLKKARKPNQQRLRFDLEKLRDPDVAWTFQATIGGKFAPLTGLSKKPWVTKHVLDLCDERRDLRKRRYKAVHL